MQAYVILNNRWQILRSEYENHIKNDENDPQKLHLCENCKSELPQGFRIHLNLQDCVDALHKYNVKDYIILEVKTVGNVNSQLIPDPKNDCFDDANNTKTTYYAPEIYTVRIVPIFEIMEYVNNGIGNVGYDNTGNLNSGCYNKGDLNSGSRNVGDKNSGDYNKGDNNYGDNNRGNENPGSSNIGDFNCGFHNVGRYNTGKHNKGNENTGAWNEGNSNSGNCNTGNNNCGDYNATDNSNGVFNTKEPKIHMFDKPSNWTLTQFHESEAYRLMCSKLQIPQNIGRTTTKLIKSEDMTEEEKYRYPSHETTGCCLVETKAVSDKTPQEQWEDLTAAEKQTILKLPNFNADIFFQMTGINVGKKKHAAKKTPTAKSSVKKSAAKTKKGIAK